LSFESRSRGKPTPPVREDQIDTTGTHLPILVVDSVNVDRPITVDGVSGADGRK